jgi:hypothetical protein
VGFGCVGVALEVAAKASNVIAEKSFIVDEKGETSSFVHQELNWLRIALTYL